jgi:predicted HTH domain antitoxin
MLTAITYFRNCKLSLGQAARFTGLNRLAFMDFWSQRGVVSFDYDASMLESEWQGVAQLRAQTHDNQ